MSFAKERLTTAPDPLLAEARLSALRDQLKCARAEIVRQQEALESFCRENLAAGRARDLAQAAAQESATARDAAVQERDALRGAVETLEAGLERARRGALDPGARRLIETLETKLELARRGSQEAESALKESARKAEADAAARLREITTAFSEREAVLLKTIEEDRRLLETTEQRLEAARRDAEEAKAETSGRRQELAEEIAARQAPLLAIVENDRRVIETMKAELDRARLEAQETARALREAAQKEPYEADERLQALRKEFAEREAEALKAEENERRRLAELTVELERTRLGAQQAQGALRESSKESLSLRETLAETQESLRRLAAESAESDARHLKAAEEDRRRLEALRLDLAQARRDARETQRAARDASHKALQDAQANAERRLLELAAERAELQSQLLKSTENNRLRREALERELERTRGEAKATASALRDSQRRSAAEAEAEAAHRLRAFKKEFSEREALLLKMAVRDRELLEKMQLRLDAQQAAAELAAPKEPDTPTDAGVEAAPFVSPPLEPVLDPGWARLLRLVRPPVDAAYAHLRRLSSTALTAGQKALLRMAAASVAQASDSLSSIELALEEGPAPGAPAPVAPVLEASLAAWEPAFRGRGVALVRDFPATLPEAAHDPKELRVALHHVLRNVLEAVPRGGRLAVRASRGTEGALRLEFSDDGPGFPPKWLESRFEPFAAPRSGRAGLGLSIVRRTLRRWGGDVEASNGPSGRGARLTLLFAPPGHGIVTSKC